MFRTLCGAAILCIATFASQTQACNTGGQFFAPQASCGVAASYGMQFVPQQVFAPQVFAAPVVPQYQVQVQQVPVYQQFAPVAYAAPAATIVNQTIVRAPRARLFAGRSRTVIRQRGVGAVGVGAAVVY